ncbi:MAG: PIN domain-containing protein [Candidatus Binataceae bacterium]
MNAALIADTGPLYAAVDPDDQHHRRAQSELRRLAREKREVVVAWPTLIEAYTLLLYRLGRQTAGRWLGEILSGARPVNPAAEDYRDAVARVMSLADQPITLFDATVAVLADRLGFQVWTYDHHFDVMRAPVWR